MDASVIAKRIRLGEDDQTEFKSVAKAGGKIEALKIAKELVAFANSRGGQLFLGVEDDGTVTGVGTVQEADALMRKVAQLCHESIRPSLSCPMIKAEIDGKLVLVVDVTPQSPDRPYRTEHAYYVRDASTSRDASREELLRMLQSQNVHFDEAPLERATLDDLDLGAVDAFLAGLYEEDDEAAPQTRRLRYLQALKCLEHGEVPTVAGILLFGRDPGRFFPDARISAVRIRGTAMADEFADKRELDGRLADQIEGAAAFLKVHVPTPSRVEGWERKELRIPEEVLREAVLNAVAHRDYRAASQVRIFVFDDRVEVVNPGGLLNHLTLESIRLGGISQRRNPVIAALLARGMRRENLGIGVPHMLRRMRKQGLPEPSFEVHGGHFRVVLRIEPQSGGEAA